MKKVIINHFMFNTITGEATQLNKLLCIERKKTYKVIGVTKEIHIKTIHKTWIDELNGHSFIQTYSLGDINKFKRSVVYELKYQIDLCERQIKSNQSEIEKYKKYIEQIEREV